MHFSFTHAVDMFQSFWRSRPLSYIQMFLALIAGIFSVHFFRLHQAHITNLTSSKQNLYFWFLNSEVHILVNSVRFFSDTVKFEAHISESILLINIVKSPTSVARYHVYMFISEGDPHLTSRFCRVELAQYLILRNIFYYFRLI
jgi:hypothetical protein